MANPVIHRVAILGLATGSWTHARIEDAIPKPWLDCDGIFGGTMHWWFLRDFAGLGPTYPLLDDRVLALVVGAPMGLSLIHI